MKTVLSVFGINPFRIGGQEAFARELSIQLSQRGWKSVVCFSGRPVQVVRDYLDHPSLTLEVVDSPERVRWEAIKEIFKLVWKYRPEIVHFYYTGFLSPYPWLARLASADRVFFTDQSSRPEAYVSRRAVLWKRLLARWINLPLSRVVCASEFGYRCMTSLDLLSVDRFLVIYNSVDLGRISGGPDGAAGFRRRFSIPEGRPLVVQVSWIIPEKGIEDLLVAARKVLARNPNVHFAFVGEGSHREHFARMANEMGLTDNVTWTGLVEDPFREGVYAAAEIGRASCRERV